jgi:hypothetical protein
MAVAVVLAGHAAAQAADLTILEDIDGVKVQMADFQATARRLWYDDAKAVLTLEGTKDSPVEVASDRNGHTTVLCAAKVTYSVNDGKLIASDVRNLRSGSVK